MTPPSTDQVLQDRLRLPPPGIPGHGGRTDRAYVRSGEEMVRSCEHLAGMTARSRVLDIGCGAGRFLVGMLATYGTVERYVGLDVRRPVIEWASQTLPAPELGEIAFEWIDVANRRYNAGGAQSPRAGALPVAAGSFDLAVLFSVFTHMAAEDIEAYLTEIHRVLTGGGRCLATVFAEEGVLDWEENPEGYLTEWFSEWKGSLHCTRVSRSFFESSARASGFEIERFVYRNAPQGKSTYVISRQS